jgi:hypothetical protein
MFHPNSTTAFAPTLPARLPLYSADFQVRLKPAQLSAIAWSHLDTSSDEEHHITQERNGAFGGLTEWSAALRGRSLTLGWDWILCDDGQLMASMVVAPRTNIQVLDDLGYDTDPQTHDASLWAIVNAIAWQSQVLQWIRQHRNSRPVNPQKSASYQI